jgi:serpin B
MSSLPRESASPDEATKAASAINVFGLDIYRRLATGDENVVFSPTSIAIALAMARAGARGETASQMDAVLRSAGAERLAPALNALDQALASRSGSFPDDEGTLRDVTLRVVNSAFAQRDLPLEASYLDALASRFGAGVRLVDFVNDKEAARQLINGWVKQQTEGRIPELLPPPAVTTNTRLALVNAIYLKAPWQVPFNRAETKPGSFTRADGSRVRVPLMHLVSSGLGPDYPVAVGSGWRAIRIPYLGAPPTDAGEQRLAMTIVVPDDLAAFERGLTPSQLARLTRTTEEGGILRIRKVDLTLPRFSIETRFELAETLAAMGMTDAFDPGRADFTGIASPPEGPLYVSRVIHQANIDLDEKGTEAAAATAVGMATGGPGDTSKPIVIRADRPFLFVLTDVSTGAILFMGRVADPSVKG